MACFLNSQIQILSAVGPLIPGGQLLNGDHHDLFRSWAELLKKMNWEGVPIFIHFHISPEDFHTFLRNRDFDWSSIGFDMIWSFWPPIKKGGTSYSENRPDTCSTQGTWPSQELRRGSHVIRNKAVVHSGCDPARMVDDYFIIEKRGWKTIEIWGHQFFLKRI
jgi:hypothetical protein